MNQSINQDQQQQQLSGQSNQSKPTGNKYKGPSPHAFGPKGHARFFNRRNQIPSNGGNDNSVNYFNNHYSMKNGRCSFNGCNGERSMFVKCGKCMKHFHTKCIQMSNQDFRDYIMKKSNYICMACNYLLRNENNEMKVKSTAGMDDSESNDDNSDSDLYQNGYNIDNSNDNINSDNNNNDCGNNSSSENDNSISNSNIIGGNGIDEIIGNNNINDDGNNNSNVNNNNISNDNGISDDSNDVSNVQSPELQQHASDQESNMINNLSQASSVSRDRSPSPSGHVSPVMHPFSGDLHNNNNSQLSQSSIDSDDEHKFEIGQYKCQLCDKLVKFNCLPWIDPNWRQFVARFVCNTCKLTEKQYCHFACVNCKIRKDPYTTSHGYKHFISHAKSHHHHIENIANMLEFKYCGIDECSVIINESEIACMKHRIDYNNSSYNIISKFDQNGKIVSSDSKSKNYNYKDYDVNNYYIYGKDKIFNMDNLFRRISIYRNRLSNTRKERIATAIVNALRDITNNIKNYNQRFEIQKRGIIKFKLIAGTYLCQFYRMDAKRITIEMEKRHKLYMDGNYNDLFKLIEIEQDKLDAQYIRRLNNRKNGNMKKRRKSRRKNIAYKLNNDEIKDNNMDNDISVQSNGNVNNSDNNNNGVIDDNKQEMKDEILDEKFNDNKKKKANPYINMNIFNNKYQQLKYYNNDLKSDVVRREIRSVFHARKGEWRKANNALDPGKRVNIYEHGNLKKAQSKFPYEKRNNYLHNNNYVKFDYENAEDKLELYYNIMIKMNPTGAPGMDGISNRLLLWILRNDNFEFLIQWLNLLIIVCIMVLIWKL